MALSTREDLLAPAISQPNRKVFELMRERIHSQAAPMPPTSSRHLTAQELDVLDLQLTAELADMAEGCEEPPVDREMWPDPDPEEIEQCYPFRAHSADVVEPKGPYRVPSGEVYACFVFDIPWLGEAQALAIRSHNSAVVHHWLLSDEVDNIPAGTVIAAPSDCGVGVNKMYAVSAASMQSMLNMPPTVGLQMPRAGNGLRMMLAVHYFNPGSPVDDTSGAEVCIARKPQPNSAGVHIVGAQDLMLPPHQMTDITTTCTPTYQGDIHIVRTLPHMHRNGVHFDTTVLRADGTRSPLINLPFDFSNQLSYQSDAVLRPGDRLFTTCEYQNDSDRTIRGGERADDEMCVNFITAWPVGSLVTGRNRSGADACSD